MVGDSSTSHGVSRVVHHKDFYLRGGDMTVLVENHLYRIHSYFFERESLFFRQKLNNNSHGNSGEERGSSDQNHYTLEDVKSEDFARFLWVFYNPKYSIYEAPLETWLSILQLANRWTFDNVKELAVRELEKITIEPVEKIAIYHDNNISRLYLIPSYVAVCKRDNPLSFTEGMKLGMETVLRIAEARERMRLQASESGIRSPTFADFEDDEVETLIRKIFQLGPGPTSPTSAGPAANGVNGSTNGTIKLNAAPSGHTTKPNSAPAFRANGGSATDPKASSVDSLPSFASAMAPQAPATDTPKTEVPATGTQATAPQEAPAPPGTTQVTSTPQAPPPPPPAADKPKETVSPRPGSAASVRPPKSAGGLGAGEPLSLLDSSPACFQAPDALIPVVLSSELSKDTTAESKNNMNGGDKDKSGKDNDTASVASDTEGGKSKNKNKRGKLTRGGRPN